MTLPEVVEKTEKYLLPTYGRLPLAFVRGEGCRLWDTEGKSYLDCLGGIAVCSLGHGHPKLAAAIAEQAKTLIHTSNLYHIPPQAELAERLYHLSGGYKSFYCNSGAEANEGAIKLARKWAKTHIGKERYQTITALDSFHGRTLTTITATGQPKYQKGFEPLPPGFVYVPYNDLAAAEKAVNAETAAILVEPIQGESGVRPATPEYLTGLRRLCDERALVLIFDEVQTGMGRTGRMFAHEHYGVKPDLMTLAKALAGGVPMGALLANERVWDGFQPGDHASTFGGNYLACAAALAVLRIYEEDGVVENAAAVGRHLRSALESLCAECGMGSEVRGMGLLLALEFNRSVAKEVQEHCLANGLIVNAIGENIVRLAPPLILSVAEADEALAILRKAVTAAADAGGACARTAGQPSAARQCNRGEGNR
jgi:predicted acetylornithine/succinylornithine family transaminase